MYVERRDREREDGKSENFKLVFTHMANYAELLVEN